MNVKHETEAGKGNIEKNKGEKKEEEKRRVGQKKLFPSQELKVPTRGNKT
jgi:hypothetical protein